MQQQFRIFCVTSVGAQRALGRLYQSLPMLEQAPADAQLTEILLQRFNLSDYLSRSLRKLGHDVCETIYDSEIRQKTWAREHGTVYDPKMWQSAILVAQILDAKPEIIIFQDSCPLPAQFLDNLRQLCPSIKQLVIHQDRPCAPDLLAKFDLRLVTRPGLGRLFAAQGVLSQLVYYGFDPIIVSELDAQFDNEESEESMHEFGFAGSSGYNDEPLFSRYWTLASIIRKTGLYAWVHEQMEENERRLSAYRRFVSDWLERAGKDDLDNLISIQDFITRNHEKIPVCELLVGQAEAKLFAVRQADDANISSTKPPLPLRELFPGRAREAEFGLELYDLYRTLKVNLNIQPMASEGFAGNPRLFEVTGVGGCLLTERGSNLSDLFALEEEVLTFSSVDEAKEKANYLLDNPEARKSIAAAGQKRTLRSHTWDNRAALIHDLLLETIHGRAGNRLSIEISGITREAEVQPKQWAPANRNITTV